MTILVTGAGGFIGYHVAAALLARGETVLGLDNLNDYYDVGLKQARLAMLRDQPGFSFVEADLADADTTALIQANGTIDRIVHLAAQAGVRYSLENPLSYVKSNVVGHLTILEAARRMRGLRHLVYASSSSVYGANKTVPFSEAHRVDQPLSLYAATKRADELMSGVYDYLFQIPQTGLRFFTVYGPWGRPDMAYFSFARAIVDGKPIPLFADGALRRDFTYIDDVVQGVIGCLDRPPAAPEGSRLFNLGNHQPESVSTLVGLLERELERKAIIQSLPRPATEVEETYADTASIRALVGFEPSTPLSEGIARFARWFRGYYGV